MSYITISELSRIDCLDLLRTTNVGQLVLTRRALPAVVPAHYVVFEDQIVVHAVTGLDPVRWNDGEIVALHVNTFDRDQRSGWTVSVTGVAHRATDLPGMRDHSRAPWIAYGEGDLIAISMDLVQGERLGSPRASAEDW